jgi:dimeric dUTPase (all-alpha-NTP-PPase superfamily)
MVVSRDNSEKFYMILGGLEALIAIQAEGAKNLPDDLHPLDQADFRTAALGMFVELGELVNEAQWKPWRSYKEPTIAERQRVLKELADVLHFLPWMIRNLGTRFSFRAQDVAQAFLEVHEENVARFTGRVPGREPPESRRSMK